MIPFIIGVFVGICVAVDAAAVWVIWQEDRKNKEE